MKLRFPHWAFAVGFSMMLLHPLRAEAALSNGKFLTPEETLAAYGQTITGRYYDGSGYVDINFYYNSTVTFGGTNTSGSVPDILLSGNQCLMYTASHVSVNTNPQYITFDLHPEFSLLNTSQIHAAACLNTSTVPSNSAYSPPRWEWYINGLNTVFQTSGSGSGNNSGVWPFCFISGDQYTKYTFVCADYTSNEAISGYSVRVSFYGNSVSGTGSYKLLLSCPYVSSDASGQIGTLPAVTTVPSTDINVNVDMTETNSLLGSIKQGIENLANGILNGLKNLFIPSETFMTDWKDDMSDELEEHLGGIYEATDILHDWAAQFRNVQASSEIYVPAVTVPLGGVSWTVGDWHVPLKPTGMPALVYDGFALIVDFLALAAFLNMCHKKLEVVLVPESEKVD